MVVAVTTIRTEAPAITITMVATIVIIATTIADATQDILNPEQMLYVQISVTMASQLVVMMTTVVVIEIIITTVVVMTNLKGCPLGSLFIICALLCQICILRL